MNNKYVIVAIVVIGALAAVIAITGGFSFSFSTASISDVETAEDVNSDLEPVNKTSEFKTNQEKIYVTLKFSNAPSDTKLKAEWYYIEEEEKIASYTKKVDGSGRAAFHLTKPDDGWPTGSYEVRLFIDGEKADNASFSIKQSKISLNPKTDLLTNEDLPSAFSENKEIGWKVTDTEISGIPVEVAASRFWSHTSEDKSIYYEGYVCPSINDAKDIADHSSNYWTGYYENIGYNVSTASFPSYGDKSKSYKATTEDITTYIITFRIQNVTVTLVGANITKTDAESYCTTLEQKIKNQK